MSATRMPPPQPAQRVGATPKKSTQQGPEDGSDFRSQLHAWLESHRASLVDSLRRLAKQPIGSFFTCLVMAVALSLPMGLALLLADEPTGNLDPRLAAEIMGVFEDINQLGTTVLIASHDLALIARMRQRMLTLQRGRLIGDGEAA